MSKLHNYTDYIYQNKLPIICTLIFTKTPGGPMSTIYVSNQVHYTQR